MYSLVPYVISSQYKSTNTHAKSHKDKCELNVRKHSAYRNILQVQQCRVTTGFPQRICDVTRGLRVIIFLPLNTAHLPH